MNTQTAVLVVEDDAGFRRTLAEGLNEAGYVVVAVASAEDALTRLGVIQVDVALVDYRLPGMDGVALLRELRQRFPNMVLIMMSAGPTVESAIEALRLEAFDYLLKPFTLTYLIKVVRQGLERRRQRAQRETLLRQLERSLAGLQALHSLEEVVSAPGKTPTPPINPGVLVFGPVKIDLQRHLAWVGQRELDLTPTEFNLLTTLADRAPAVVSPQELLRQATNFQGSPAEARDLVKWHIHHLRAKVESDSKNPRHIINVRGVGYRLAAP